MSDAQLEAALSKLNCLSDARVERVVSLIDDLAELEVLENAADLLAARAALGEPGEPKPWAQVKAELDAQYGLPQQAS